MISFLKKLNKVTTAINKFAMNITGALFAGMIFCASTQVICRFILKISTPWAEEWARFLFVWTTLLGASCASKLVKHINVDALVGRLKGKTKIIINVISSLVLVGLYIVCIKSGVDYTMRGYQQVSAITDTNMAAIYVSLPISFGLMLIYEIEIILQTIFNYHSAVDNTVTIGGTE